MNPPVPHQLLRDHPATVTAAAVTHHVYATMRRSERRESPAGEPATRDRGAVSLEQVLWFVASGVSVAVIAAILWNQIREQASTPINSPSAP